MIFCLPLSLSNCWRQERFQLPPKSNLSPSPSPFSQYNCWGQCIISSPPTLLLVSLVWGGQQQGSSFPGCRQGWEPALKPRLGQHGAPHSWSRAGAAPELQDSPASLLSCWMIRAYSDTALGCCRDWALPSAVLTGGKKNKTKTRISW